MATGEIFSSPTAKSFLDAMRAANGGAGVACLYGNYTGDNMNVRMAMAMAEREGIAVQTVVANDDVPSAARGEEDKRRGVAGEILMWKVGAAKAARGGSLDEVIAVAQKAVDRTRSIGIGLSACVIPAVGKANFTIKHGSMEVCIGHHGEPGIDVRPTLNAAELAALMLDTILPDLLFAADDRVAVLVSGLGATPTMELYILYREIVRRLREAAIDIVFNRVGNLFTSLEMMGVTLTLMKVDDELESCLTYPCASVGLSVAGDAERRRAYAGRLAATPVAVPLAAAASRAACGPSIVIGKAGDVVRNLILTINSNRQHLSEIDGLIGDSDHGVNMSKGFSACATRLDALPGGGEDLLLAFDQLAQALMDDVGGSMGALYGRFFLGLVDVLGPHAQMDAALFGDALAVAAARVQATGNAQVGDKTLIDTLVPALTAYREALAGGASFAQCLQAMSRAAEAGKDSTRNLQARVGRSARLGPRSIGAVNAGASSCCLIRQSISASLRRLLGDQGAA